jgi:lipopolysaccharide exporter
VLWNTGRKHQESMLQLPVLAIAGPAWWLFAPSGIRGVAIVSAVVIFARAAVIVGASLNALQVRWTTIVPYAARGLGLSALCAAAVLAGQEAVSMFTFPGASLYAGTLAAAATMALVLFVRPQALGLEAQSALARLVPRFGPRLAPAVAGADPAGDSL